MKPSERNAIKAIADEARREISRLERSLEGFKSGTLPHQKLTSQLAAARAKHKDATASLKPITQAN